MLTSRRRWGAARRAGSWAAGVTEIGLVFYRDEYVLVEQDDGAPPGSRRANFVRDADGHVAWFSYGGRLYARQR